MERNIGHKKFKIYSLEFGTHNDDELLKQYETNPLDTETGIWCWYLIDEKVKYTGFNMESLISKLKELSKPSRTSSSYVAIYTHNLSSKFSFMFPYLQELEFNQELEEKTCNAFNIIANQSLGSVWDLKLKFHKGRSLVMFRDIQKILGGGSLDDLCKALKLPLNDIYYDTRINRRADGQKPSKNDLKAIYNRANVVQHIVNLHKDDKYFFKASSAASYSFKQAIDFAYKGELKPYTAYREDYPVLDKSEDEFVRRSVEGGLTGCNGFYKGKEQQNVIHYDLHNAYPSIYYKCKLPYGKGIRQNKYIEVDENFDGCLYKGCYTVCKCCVDVQFKKFNFKRELGEYLLQVYIYCWDFEIPYLFKCYNAASCAIEETITYKTKYSRFGGYFASNYKKRLEARKEHNQYNVMYYKMLNNSFYGKTGEKAYNDIYIPKLVDGCLYVDQKHKEEEEYLSTYTYTPLFSCVSALVRKNMFDAIFEIGLPYVYYVDTDSIFCDDNPKTREFWSKQEVRDFLGCWGLEEKLQKATFVADKRYKTLTVDGSTIVHNAGFTYSDNEKYNDINLMNDTRYVAYSIKIKGGTIVSPVIKSFKSDIETETDKMLKSGVQHDRYIAKIQNDKINLVSERFRWDIRNGYAEQED